VLGPRFFNHYVEGVSEIFDQHHLCHHLFVDDMQYHCSGRPSEAFLMVSCLDSCIVDVSARCGSRQLHLNGDKQWPGPSLSITALSASESRCYLSVWIDYELSMRQHVSRVAHICFSICAVYARFVDNSDVMFLHD